MTPFEVKALLVALGCPGPELCDGFWPAVGTEAYLLVRVEQYRPHMEKHMRECLELADDEPLP